jgi:hypothetical protein
LQQAGGLTISHATSLPVGFEQQILAKHFEGQELIKLNLKFFQSCLETFNYL